MIRATILDIVVVSLVSAAVTFCGNLVLMAKLDRASPLIVSQSTRHRLNVVTCLMLFIVASFVFIM